MSKLICIDDLLYKEIRKIRDAIKSNGCKNPSFSNAVRTMADMSHISTKSRHDECNKNAREYLYVKINLSKESKDSKENKEPKEKELND